MNGANGRVRTMLYALLAALGSAPAFAASDQYHLAVEAAAPTLWYQFNETSGNAIDHSSEANTFEGVYHGTVTRGAPTWSGDLAVSFDAVEDYVESLAVSPVAFTGNPTFSTEAVIFVPVTGSAALWAPFLHWGPSPAGSENGRSVYFSFSHYEPEEAYVGFYNGGLQSQAGSMEMGYWHHLVWVRTGGGTDQQGSKLYLDGVDVSATLVADPNLCCNGTTPNVGATAFRVNRARDFESQRFFVGSIDEVALYGRALTAQEAQAHFTALGWIFADNFEKGSLSRWSNF